MFNQDSHSLIFFDIHELGENSGVVSRCLLRDFEFKVFLLLDWLPPKVIELSLLYYLIHSCEKKLIQAFHKGVSVKVNETDEPGI